MQTSPQEPTRADREKATRQAVAFAGLAGCEITPFGASILARLNEGEITHDQAVQLIIERHRNTGGDTEPD